jgi:hypothetical protein
MYFLFAVLSTGYESEEERKKEKIPKLWNGKPQRPLSIHSFYLVYVDLSLV